MYHPLGQASTSAKAGAGAWGKARERVEPGAMGRGGGGGSHKERAHDGGCRTLPSPQRTTAPPPAELLGRPRLGVQTTHGQAKWGLGSGEGARGTRDSKEKRKRGERAPRARVEQNI